MADRLEFIAFVARALVQILAALGGVVLFISRSLIWREMTIKTTNQRDGSGVVVSGSAGESGIMGRFEASRLLQGTVAILLGVLLFFIVIVFGRFRHGREQLEPAKPVSNLTKDYEAQNKPQVPGSREWTEFRDEESLLGAFVDALRKTESAMRNKNLLTADEQRAVRDLSEARDAYIEKNQREFQRLADWQQAATAASAVRAPETGGEELWRFFVSPRHLLAISLGESAKAVDTSKASDNQAAQVKQFAAQIKKFMEDHFVEQNYEEGTDVSKLFNSISEADALLTKLKQASEKASSISENPK